MVLELLTSLVITLKQELRKRGEDPVGFRIVDIPSDSNAGIKEEMGRFQLVLELLTSLVITLQELKGQSNKIFDSQFFIIRTGLGH